VAGAGIERIYNYHDVHETYDSEDAVTQMSTLFNLEEQVQFSVNFKEKPQMEMEKEKPAAKASGRAEKVCKGIFGFLKKDVNELDGTYTAKEGDAGAAASELKAVGNELFKAKRFKDAVAAYTAAIAKVTAELGEGVMGTVGEQVRRGGVGCTRHGGAAWGLVM
jgi:hypothetical protein